MCYDQLEKLKRIIARDRNINIFVLIFLLVFLFACLYAVFLNAFVALVALPLLVMILFMITCITENNRLLRQFSDIVRNKALNKTYSVKLHNPKIKFLAYPEVKTRSSLLVQYYGLTMKDGNKKYYYFFEECMWYDKTAVDNIYQKTARELSVQCYENTTIVKTIENDAHFVHIQWGKSL